MLLITIRGLDA